MRDLSLRDFLRSQSEQLENELDASFNDGQIDAQVRAEALFGLNGQDADAFGNRTLEDVAAHYNRALATINNPEGLLDAVFGMFANDAVSQPDGFADPVAFDIESGSGPEPRDSFVYSDDEVEEIEEEAFSDGYDDGYEDGKNDALDQFTDAVDRLNEQLAEAGYKVELTVE